MLASFSLSKATFFSDSSCLCSYSSYAVSLPASALAGMNITAIMTDRDMTSSFRQPKRLSSFPFMSFPA